MRLCYFEDQKRRQQCELLLKYSDSRLELAEESASEEQQNHLEQIRRLID